MVTNEDMKRNIYVYLRCKKFNAEKFQLNLERRRNFPALNFSSTKFFNDEIFGTPTFLVFFASLNFES